MSFNRADIEKQLMFFLFFYVSMSFGAGKFFQGAARGFFRGHFLTMSEVPLFHKRKVHAALEVWNFHIFIKGM